MGYHVVGEALDGADLLVKYRSLKPDFILADISMPRMDGITALKEIRKTDLQTKVVMVSAMGEEEYVRAAINAGADGFILKPFEIETLVNILNDLAKTI